MVFSSIPFLFYFLPIFLVLYAFLPWKNLTLACASMVFYIWGEGYFALILIGSVGFNFVCGAVISSAPDRRRRLALGVGIALNLAVLIAFKYSGFLAYDLFRLDPALALPLPRLPVGISFFTFQAISYLIDVYRREAQPARSFLDLTTYIAMFPQLIAGPIVRYSTVARRLRSRSVSLRNLYFGGLYFAFGLAQKVLIADTMAGVADPIFALPADSMTTANAWAGSLAYTMQIYFDFAGYSNMAIGLGLVLGFKFPRNFNYPYISQSITEFWRRWHMSLSSWFRDYLYIPLGGNRLGPLKTYRNLFAVFFLCGLWHGAAWTFVAWGLYHGLLLTLERAGKARLPFAIPGLASHLYLLLATVIGWVIFRSETFGQAGFILKAMAGLPDAGSLAPNVESFVSHQAMLTFLVAVPASLGIVEWLSGKIMVMPSRTIFDPGFTRLKTLVSLVVAVILVALSSLLILSGSYSAFIYFRF